MKKLLLAIMALFSISLCAQQAIIVEHNNTPHVFDRLDSAIAFASNGDDVYISGGSFNIGTLIIGKSVKIYGVGHNLDSTQATNRTQLNGTLKFITGADNCLISGIYLTGDVFIGTNTSNDSIQNLQIIRNNINQISLSYNGSYSSKAKNVSISENIVRSSLFAGMASNTLIEKNIITGQIGYLDNSVIRNNVFLYRNTTNCASDKAAMFEVLYREGTTLACTKFYSTNTTVFNSVFLNNFFRDSFSGDPNRVSSGCVFSYNAFEDTQFNVNAGSNTGTGNIFDVTDSDFINYDSDPYSANYRLTQNSAAALAGDDGTDIGIYGTTEPFKDGSIPINPHIQQKIISIQGNTIQLQVRVKAQER